MKKKLSAFLHRITSFTLMMIMVFLNIAPAFTVQAQVSPSQTLTIGSVSGALGGV